MTLLVRQFSCKHYDTACTPSSVIFAHCLTRLNDKSLCAISLITSILSHDYVMGWLCAKKIEIFDIRSAFRTNSLPGSGSSSANNSLGRSLRNDLLVAADSVTNAMSTLVRELNSDFEAGEDGDDSSGGGNSWREELQRRYQQENDFLAELRARNVNMSQTERTSAASSNEQEQDRGDREEAEGGKEDENETDWSEAVKRWPIVGIRSMFHSPLRYLASKPLHDEDDTPERRKRFGESSLQGDKETPRVVFFSRKLGAPRRLLVDEIKRVQVGRNRSAARRYIFERSLETRVFARIMADRVQAEGHILFERMHETGKALRLFQRNRTNSKSVEDPTIGRSLFVGKQHRSFNGRKEFAAVGEVGVGSF
ncbi:hypothetical protein HZH66_011946 [Vespula vulgaris]|uniref:Uncharacterized protein n=1 Tax=Vespula vulgaris TaxID=7454 RepID=A0A834MUF2_VESVU|nr:hypothetical protein HZH66_011946 [Vespula vulgaris]